MNKRGYELLKNIELLCFINNSNLEKHINFLKEKVFIENKENEFIKYFEKVWIKKYKKIFNNHLN